MASAAKYYNIFLFFEIIPIRLIGEKHGNMLNFSYWFILLIIKGNFRLKGILFFVFSIILIGVFLTKKLLERRRKTKNLKYPFVTNTKKTIFLFN